jgi:hypothetical protein
MTAPDNPAGAYTPEPNPSPARRAELIAEIERFPEDLRRQAAVLSPRQLDAKYKNWTARQLIHHLADSHANGYIRTKLTLTEDRPTIKPYDETKWSALPDATSMDVELSLRILEGVHARWAAVWRAMTVAEFGREYFHPEYGKPFKLAEVLGLYAWHGRHHGAMVEWICKNR